MKNHFQILTAIFFLSVGLVIYAEEQSVLPEQNRFVFSSPEEMKAFFSTDSAHWKNGYRLVSAHRGGARKGFPENCIATFEDTLRQMPALFEIDPRLTKDGVVVLMHDETINRTTNGSGRVRDYTYEELKRFRLKDSEGNVTDDTIPTLRETIEWAKGKTVLVLDKKDVPLETTQQLIRECQAETWCMVIVYNYEEAKNYHAANKDIMMEAFVTKTEDVERFEKTGIPWENVIPFVGLEEPPGELYQLLGQRQRPCMVGCTRTIDRKVRETGSTDVYEKLYLGGSSILETDLPLETKKVLKR
jgi:glycerophosphoryl diester phosphodiesterase